MPASESPETISMMINRPDGIASAPSFAKSASATAAGADAGLVPQFRMMTEALWASPVRNSLVALSGSMFAVIAAAAYGQIRLNTWNQPFYDALSKRDFAEFLHQLGIFGLIAGVLLVLNVAQRWLSETAKIKMREGLVQDLVNNWMRPGRAFRLAQAGAIGVNPDQRLHEDARHLTELSADLGIGLLQASILLAMFINVLWAISNQFSFKVAGHDIAIPGYMVWAAIAYSGTASLLSYWVGRDLVDRNVEHYAREADLRYSLVRISDHIDAISLSGGEADEARHILADLAAVLAAMRKIVSGITRLTWVTAGSGWITIVAPILAAAPLYFAGRLSFGGLMLASGAFMQVQSSLRWFVDNFSTIADWRATLLRVAAFRRAMICGDAPVEAESHIDMAKGPAGSIVIQDLQIVCPSGTTRLAEGSVTVGAGERVLVIGDSRSGKTLLFRALAGLWLWGTGRIALPKGEEVQYMPRMPYLPPGTLRATLAYPLTPERVSGPACTDALSRFGLARLVPSLDSIQRWDRDLPEADRRALAFARVLLHRPAWLVMDDVFNVLDAPMLQRVAEVFATELKGTGVIHIGAGDGFAKAPTKVAHLVRDTAKASDDAEQS
jgi:vitamin B12/bleomycin/antimicrobial peptide transport system ATP-binding/permease protein